jgi:uncharacterized membrane protein YfcA
MINIIDKILCTIKGFGTMMLGMFAGVLTYADIDKDVFKLYTLFLFIDVATGLYKAYRLKITIESSKMIERISAKVITLFIPVLVGVAVKMMEGDWHFFYTYVMNLLIVAEVYSIIGNSYSGATKQDIPEWDAVTDITKFIRNLIFRGKDKIDELDTKQN